MKIGHYYNALDLHRKEKVIYGQFLKPHRVLSTCRANGGLREDLHFLYNHQSCEPSGHTGIDLCTVAVGDPASYYQSTEGSVNLNGPMPKAGTINTLVFLSQEFTAGALVVAATVATEAKTALLQELSAPSRYSSGIATGTGTDQIGIASQLGTPLVHSDANKHSKAGELIAQTVRQSLQEALNLQCGMTPDNRRSTIAMLQRFGESQTSFIQGVTSHLEDSQQRLFRSNFLSANHDPLAVAATQALIHLRDQITWGILPDNCIQEILLTYAAHIAKVVSQKNIELDTFISELGDSPLSTKSEAFLSLVHKSFAIGFSRKWDNRFED